MAIPQTSKTGIILATVAILGTLGSAITFNLTKDRIAENVHTATVNLFGEVLPNVQYDNNLITDTISVRNEALLGIDKPVQIHRATLNGNPVAAILNVVAPKGYSGKIYLIVGIDYEGVVRGVRVVKHKETPGLGDKIELRKSDWIRSFENTSLSNPSSEKWKVKKDGGYFDQMTGATITPRAVVNAVLNAQLYFQKNKELIFSSTTSVELKEQPHD